MFVTKIPDNEEFDDYRVHQKVKSIFPGAQKVLFQRLDGFVTIVSEYPPEDGTKTKEITFDDIKDDQFLFSVTLNPVTRCGNRPKRVPYINLKQWVIDKMEKTGVSVIPETLSIEPGCRTSQKGDTKISLYSALILGAFDVIDKDKFWNALCNGVGRGKGLGFGLLNIF